MLAAVVLLAALGAQGHSDDYESSDSHHDDNGHHHGDESVFWFWFLLVIGATVLMCLCLGVGWYGGSRRREYYIRKPDGSVLGYVETDKSGARPRRVGRRRGAVVGYALGSPSDSDNDEVSRAKPAF